MANSTFSIIGTDVVIRGNIEASADLHIDGKVVGDISCASLVTGESSTIAGEVVADNARVSGHVAGKLFVGSLAVLSGATIDGDVEYDTISFADGAVINGQMSKRKAGAAPLSLDDAMITDGEAGSPEKTIFALPG